MNVAIQMSQIVMNNIFFLERIKNTVMDEGYFIRFLYSNSLFSLHGIYVTVSLKMTAIDSYYNKYKCIFNREENKVTIDEILLLEKTNS